MIKNCLMHGMTEHTKSGKCKECAKYNRKWRNKYEKNSIYGDLNVTEIIGRLPHKVDKEDCKMDGISRSYKKPEQTDYDKLIDIETVNEAKSVLEELDDLYAMNEQVKKMTAHMSLQIESLKKKVYDDLVNVADPTNEDGLRTYVIKQFAKTQKMIERLEREINSKSDRPVVIGGLPDYGGGDEFSVKR